MSSRILENLQESMNNIDRLEGYAMTMTTATPIYLIVRELFEVIDVIDIIMINIILILYFYLIFIEEI
jgi:hypothetical protein